jgi:hypothetical protein
VLDELELRDFLEVKANSDEVVYDGQKIISWRSPPMNKGFGVGTFFLVVVIIIMLVPGVGKFIGLF